MVSALTTEGVGILNVFFWLADQFAPLQHTSDLTGDAYLPRVRAKRMNKRQKGFNPSIKGIQGKGANGGSQLE